MTKRTGGRTFARTPSTSCAMRGTSLAYKKRKSITISGCRLLTLRKETRECFSNSLKCHIIMMMHFMAYGHYKAHGISRAQSFFIAMFIGDAVTEQIFIKHLYFIPLTNLFVANFLRFFVVFNGFFKLRLLCLRFFTV